MRAGNRLSEEEVISLFEVTLSYAKYFSGMVAKVSCHPHFGKRDLSLSPSPSLCQSCSPGLHVGWDGTKKIVPWDGLFRVVSWDGTVLKISVPSWDGYF